MKFSMVFSAVDKASRTMRKIMAQEKKMARSNQRAAAKAAQGAGRMDRILSRAKRTFTAVRNAGKIAFGAVVKGAKLAGRAIGALHHKSVALGKIGFGQIGKGFGRAKGGIIAGIAAITIAYGGAAAAASGLVGTVSDFEKFQTILTTTEGSAEAAEKAMGWVTNFAVKTPYELDQVTDSFVKLRAYGLDPTQGLLTSLGDTSAAMGKPLMQAVEAVADAVTGENERLKEFGIKASKSGSMITYAYTNSAGKAVEVAVKATDRLGIQQQLMAIMNEKFAGSMGRLSQTWSGMMSNLADQWMKFQLLIMKSGLFDWMKGKLASVLYTINKMEADGTLQEWATQIGNTIQTALSNMWNFGVGVFVFFQTLSGYLSSAAEYVGGWQELSMILAGIVFAPMLVSTAAGLVQIATGLAALTTALMANPIILAIAAIAGGVYLIYRNWDKIGPYFQRIWDNVKVTVSTVWDWLKAAFKWTPLGLLVDNWKGLKDALSDPIESGKALIETSWLALKAMFAWHPLALIVTNWEGLKAALADPIEDAKARIETAWNAVKAVFSGDWLPDFSEWGTSIATLHAVAWEELVSLQALQDAWSAVTSWFGSVAAGIWGMIPEMPNWVKDAFALFESKPQVNIEEITRKSVVQSGSLDRSQMSAKQLEVLERMDKFREKHHKPVALIENPKTLLEAANAAQKLERELPALSKAAEVALKDTGTAINSIRDLLSQTDFNDQGVALMRTLAEGIRNGTHLVVAATVAATQQVRDHLPSSPAKTGPLSDIHRLKFGETIASSIRGEPMVKAMRAAAAATLAVAMPATQDIAFAATAVPSSATVSALPSAREARSASTPGPLARSGGARSVNTRSPISVTFGDTHINGGSPNAQRELRETAAQERRKFVRLLKRHDADERRKGF